MMKTTKGKVGIKKLMSFVMILTVVTIANTAFDVESETEKTIPRETFVLNRGWEFFRPEPAAVYEPPKETLVAQGEFSATGEASVVRFEKRVARQVCLVGRSSHQGEFVSVAEFELLDSAGKPTQNAFIERFNGSFRREFLSAHLFDRLREMAHEWMVDLQRGAFS